MSSLATIRAAVRNDLHDEDATAYRWTDAVLQRHIERALLDYSQASPLEQKSTLSTVAGSRDISISTLTPRLRVSHVEWPTTEYPPAYVPFSLWGDTLTMDLVSPPSGVENVNVFWHKVHAINGSVTFPASHDDIIATGAAAYAALEWASFASNRVNVGGDNVWGKYIDFANVRLTEFQRMLRELLPAANTLRTGTLYTPAVERLTSQATDPGPV
jgi:hypothetical protein